MSPKQKQLSDKLISIVTIALITLLAIVVTVFLINEIEERTNIRFFETAQVEKLKPLDSNEVAEQRIFLPSDSLFISATDEVGMSQLTTRLLMSDETPTLQLQKSQAIPQELISQPIQNSNDTVSKNLAYIDPGSEIIVTSVTSGLPSGNSANTFATVLSGTVSKVDVSGRVMTLVNDDRPVMVVIIEPETRIFINGRNMSLEDVMIGDILRVEGQTKVGSTVTTAKVVAVIGTTEVINVR